MLRFTCSRCGLETHLYFQPAGRFPGGWKVAHHDAPQTGRRCPASGCSASDVDLENARRVNTTRMSDGSPPITRPRSCIEVVPGVEECRRGFWIKVWINDRLQREAWMPDKPAADRVAQEFFEYYDVPTMIGVGS
jgi:hypothetical protein